MSRCMCVLVVAAIVLTAFAQEGTTQDASVEDLIERLGSNDQAVYGAARKALAAKGAEIIPELLAVIDAGERRQQQGAVLTLGDIGREAAAASPKLRELAKEGDRDLYVRAYSSWAIWRIDRDAEFALPVMAAFLKDRSPANRAWAATTIAEMGLLAKDAIPDLLEALRREYDAENVDIGATYQIKRAIGAMKADAIPGLISLLEEEDETLRADAVYLLGELKDAAGESVGSLQAAYASSTKNYTRMRLAEAIWKITEETQLVLEAAQRSLSAGDGDKSGQRVAVMVLVEMRELAEPATSTLQKAIASEDYFVRAYAAQAFWRITGESDVVVPVLVELLEIDAGSQFGTAADILEEFGPMAEPASDGLIKALSSAEKEYDAIDALRAIGKVGVPKLIEALSDESARVRANACRVLYHFGPDAKDAIPRLAELLVDADANVREQASLAISVIDRSSDHVETSLITNLQSDSDAVRLRAMKRLTERFGLPSAALPLFVRLVQHDKNAEIRRLAADIISNYGEEARSQTDVLVEAFQIEQDEAVQRRIAAALVAIEAENTKAIPAFELALKSEDAALRVSAARQIDRFGAVAVPPLANALSDSNAKVVAAAARSLGFLAQEAEIAPDQLLMVIEHPDAKVRAAVAWALGELRSPEERCVSALVTRAREDTDTEVRRSAIEALGEIGTAAKESSPVLLQVIQSREEGLELRREAASALWRISINGEVAEFAKVIAVTVDPQDDAIVVRHLCGVVGLIGLPAVEALSDLRKIALTPSFPDDTRNSAIDAIGSFGAESKVAVGDLFQILNDAERPGLHRSAASAIQTIGASAADVTTLITSFTNPSPQIRVFAVRIVAGIRKDARAAVGELTRLFQQDESTEVRGAALAAIAAIDPDSPGLLQLVERGLADPDPHIRAGAAQCVMPVGAAARSLVPHLVKAMDDPDLTVSTQAFRAIGALGPDAKDAVPRLIALIKADQPAGPLAMGRTSMFARTLGLIGAEATSAVPALMEALDESSIFYDRKEIVDALDQIGLNGDPTYVPRLTKILTASKDYPYFRVWAARSLFNLGPVDHDAITPLTKALNDEAIGVKYWAASALGGYGSDAKDAVDPLHALLDETDNRLVTAAAHALGSIGPQAAKAVPTLRIRLRDGPDDVRLHACIALGRIGVATDEVVESLVIALQDEEQFVALAAVDALARFKGDAVGQLSAVVHSSRDSVQRKLAARSLGLIGADARSSVGELQAALSDQVADVQEEAAITLTKIIRAIQPPEREFRKTVVAVDDSIQATQSVDNSVKSQSAAIRADYRELFPEAPLEKFLRNAWTQRAAVVIAIVIGIVMFWSILLWQAPLSLLRISEMLRPFEQEWKIPFGVGTMHLPVRKLILLSPFIYRERVLDAWVDANSHNALETFNTWPTVAKRLTHVRSAPVDAFEMRRSTTEALARIRPLFSQPRATLLIHGEGGSGKTSFACELARYASNGGNGNGTPSHRMLPVLIDTPFSNGLNGGETLDEMIFARLQELVPTLGGDEEELVEHLILRRRVLVIIDRLSEMPQSTRDAFRPRTINALVVTSRQDEQLDGVARTTISPCRLDGSALTVFVEDYLRQQRLRVDDEEVEDESESWYSQIKPSEIHNACYKLSKAMTHPLAGGTPVGDAIESLKGITTEPLVDAVPAEAGPEAGVVQTAKHAELLTIPENDYGSRACTPFLAKRLADAMIALKREGRDGDELPEVIPSLIYGYVDEQNSQVPEDRRHHAGIIHNAVESVAWACVEEHLFPSEISELQAIDAIRQDNSQQLLDYLLTEIGILLRTGMDHAGIQFSLDPLAEYYGAMYILREFTGRGSNSQWESLKTRLKKVGGDRTAAIQILGFCDALIDCSACVDDSSIPADLVAVLHNIVAAGRS